jgi:hypothetical protein
MSEKQTFEAATLVEANRLADEWWAKQKEIRLVHRTQTNRGWGTEAERWRVTIHFEPETDSAVFDAAYAQRIPNELY